MRFGSSIIAIALGSLVSASGAPASEAKANEEVALRKINPIIGFKYFSGNLKNKHNHPAMFAYAYGEAATLVVTGNGFYREYPLQKASEAFDAYQRLLKSTGYR